MMSKMKEKIHYKIMALNKKKILMLYLECLEFKIQIGLK